MPYGSQRFILAHELGHLLMHSGHCSWLKPNGHNEGSAPASNLMNADIIRNGGTELNREQIEVMLDRGSRYAH
jgi:hypothetical protein